MKQILIVKFGALGDVVRTSYLLPALKRKYPATRVWWWTAVSAAPLLRFNPYVDVLVTGLGALELRDQTFDLAISLDDEMEILQQLSALKARRIVGAYLENGQRTYCHHSAPWFDMGLISHFGKERADELKKRNQREHHQFLERMLNLEISTPEFFNSPMIEARWQTQVSDPRSFVIGLNPGSGSRWPAKQLPESEAVLLIAHLLECEVDRKPTRVLLLGGADETTRNRRIAAQVRSNRLSDATDCGTVLDFAALIKACDYLISSDSLALHLGIAQQIPNLSFFAPTSAVEIGTFGTGTKVVSTAPDYCSYRPDADNRSITADRLVAAFLEHTQARRIPADPVAVPSV